MRSGMILLAASARERKLKTASQNVKGSVDSVHQIDYLLLFDQTIF